VALSECVHDFQTTGIDLAARESGSNLFVDIHHDGRYFALDEVYKQLAMTVIYDVQKIETTHKADSYDDRYIKYYHYSRVLEFLGEFKSTFDSAGYISETIGTSLAGRDLKVVYPKEFDPSKKLIIMFGRHHGDEGTANWIIEGFVESFFQRPEILEQYQLVLYPMVNPDGAENKVRYNNNRRDLNRVWAISPSDSKDEVQFIHTHMTKLVERSGLKPVIVLDMHGSFDEDFIYRVGQSTFGRSYYQMQQSFIDELGSRDPWQAGNFILSEGSPGMARIRLASVHGWHTLTHETPRDIPLNNRQNRKLQSLKEQGVAALNSIEALY
tara:strand:- start:7344 stop:8321 length:978 start_codon:yes stop_codon:yes gene_type:complete